MKLPALRAKLGTRDFYITTLTFEQVAEHVERIDDNLYVSKGLNDLLQRSITSNVQGISRYILNQSELFFNSLVLAVYDNYPQWQELVIRTDEAEYFQIGLLDFPGHHKIFPIDGQHRVEGIKEALLQNPELGSQQIGAIFIGHENTEVGRKKTRRLFTTLNRYAKAVSLRDSIALDEDDTVAIVTRELLEEFDLFKGKRILDDLGKPIPPSNRDALTSIITLYQCNLEIYKDWQLHAKGKKVTKRSLETLLRFRPDGRLIKEFKAYALSIWTQMKIDVEALEIFTNTQKNPAAPFRNSENGGHILFRPAGLLPFVRVAIRLRNSIGDYPQVFSQMKKIPVELEALPWQSVLWNQLEKKMITNSTKIVYLMMLWLSNETMLTEKELKQLREGYASRIGMEANPENALERLRENK